MNNHLAASDFMKLGLETAMFKGWENHQAATQANNCSSAHGVSPETSRDIWNRIKAFEDEHSKLPNGTKPIHLLLAHRFLWKCHDEKELGRFFGMCENTVRKWVRTILPRIQLLLEPEVRKV